MVPAINGACKILRSTGLSDTQVYPILNLIEKWVRSNGEEWTVNRLKLLKQGFVNHLAGLSFRLPENSWIKATPSGPKGPFRALMKMKKKPHKALSAFMVYSSFVSKRITNAQKQKFLDGVNTLGKDFDADTPFFSKFFTEFGRLETTSHFSWMPLRALLNKEIRIPYYKWSTDEWEAPKLGSCKNSMEGILSTASAPFIGSWLKRRGPQPDVQDLYWHARKNIPQTYVGKVGFIQEPGYKLRSVANPFPVYQIALSAFGSLLYNNLRNIPEDATFDQDRGVLEIQNYMREGGELVAFDLSSATDTFPFWLTKTGLETWEGVHRADLDLWSDLSRGTWQSSLGDIRWKTGQPLGVFPSFAAFALSHHALLRACTKGFYRILGDDVVINKEDAPVLRSMYDYIGCTISEQKSIDSPILTEFGGRLITRDKILSQPKWHAISDRSFIDLARQIGPNILGLLPPRQRRIVKLLSEVPKALHPYGMNWNPLGKPFSQRVEESAEIISRLGLKDDLIPQAPIQSMSLRDLPAKIQLRSASNDAISIKFGDSLDLDSLLDVISRRRGTEEVEEDVSPNRANTFESQLLEFLGIKHIEGVNLLPGWFLDNSFISSDPRGLTTLSLLERKLKGVRATGAHENEQGWTSPGR